MRSIKQTGKLPGTPLASGLGLGSTHRVMGCAPGATGNGGQFRWWKFSRCENSARVQRAERTGNGVGPDRRVAPLHASLRLAARAVLPSDRYFQSHRANPDGQTRY